MNSVRMFEIIPGLKVAELSEMPVTDACNKALANEPRFKRGSVNPNIMPEQYLREKLARNHGWSVCKSGFNNDTNEFWFETALNAKESDRKILSIQEACDTMHWKSMKFVNNGMSVKFVQDFDWLETKPTVVLKKKRGRKAKSAK